MIPFLDLRRQYNALSEEIGQRVKEVLESGQYILGKNVVALEEEISHFLGARHAVGVASGTDALHLALVAAGIGERDEVITTPFTFAATAEAISYVGAKPVFVDIDPVTFNINPGRIEPAITSRTRAVLPVHLFGLPADMDRIMAVAARHDLVVVEDCAQSFDARIAGRATGTIGLAGCFSFYPSKNLGGYGDGGMVVTSSDALLESLRMLRNHGSNRPYRHERLGFNSRLDELQAAILRIKVKHIRTYNEKRGQVARLYDELLADVPVTTPSAPDNMTHVYCQYTIRTPHRDEVRQRLTDAGIGSAVYYSVPMHRQALYADQSPSLPVCDQLARECLSLPIYPELSEEQVGLVAQQVKRALE